MIGASRLYWIQVITPLHVGTGRGIGFIDLPIMREKTTDWPIVPGSAVKGVWRAHAVRCGVDPLLVEAAFGRGTENEDDHAGSLSITDARIVMMPVRSLLGTFAYVTSPLALARARRDMQAMGLKGVPEVPPPIEVERILTTKNSVLVDKRCVYLEDLDFYVAEDAGPTTDAETQPLVDHWATFLAHTIQTDSNVGSATLAKRFAIVADSAFDYLCEQGTEVNARIRISEKTKTVDGGALWYEESLPAEAVLVGIVLCERVFGHQAVTPERLLDRFCGTAFSCQMGGKSSVGRGLVNVVFTKGGADGAEPPAALGS